MTTKIINNSPNPAGINKQLHYYPNEGSNNKLNDNEIINNLLSQGWYKSEVITKIDAYEYNYNNESYIIIRLGESSYKLGLIHDNEVINLNFTYYSTLWEGKILNISDYNFLYKKFILKENVVQIFIPFNTPSLKNSKIKTSRGIFPSKTCKKYLSNLGIQSYSVSKKVITGYKTKPNIFLECITDEFRKYLKEAKKPVKLGFYFIRATKAKSDFNNLTAILTDLLTASCVIEDDNMDEILPFPLEIDGRYYEVSKEKQGCIIKILE